MIQKIKHLLMQRSREGKLQLFLSTMKPSQESTLLDVGVADREYSPFDNYLEKKYPYRGNLTALSIYPLEEFRTRYPDVKVVTYNGGKFPFRDKQFSIVFSNAVIEHVGDFNKQVFFLRELARSGEKFFFTTPAKEFPIELHTNYPIVHWLPKSSFDKSVKWLGKGWASGDYMNLLSLRTLQRLLKASGLTEFRIYTHKLCFLPLHYSVYGRELA